jgi:hypothetical protein
VWRDLSFSPQSLRGFQIEVISFVAKLPHASCSNTLGRVQLENRREAKRFKSAAASFPSKCGVLQPRKSRSRLAPTAKSSQQCGVWFNALECNLPPHCGLLNRWLPMETHSRTPEINGVEPALGYVCTAFKVVHYYENAQITDLANVTFLRLAETWFRIYFEPSTVFWRKDSEPKEPTNSDFSSGLLVNDLSEDHRVVGRELKAIEYIGESARTQVVLRWSGRSFLKLDHSHDSGSTNLIIGC